MWRKEELLESFLTIGAGAGVVATARHTGGYIGLIPFPVPDLLLKGLNSLEKLDSISTFYLFSMSTKVQSSLDGNS